MPLTLQVEWRVACAIHFYQCIDMGYGHETSRHNLHPQANRNLGSTDQVHFVHPPSTTKWQWMSPKGYQISAPQFSVQCF